ncbi:hypothetical protein BDA99DRAFT_531527 [Phascolomyces articulosus]|uniref:Uncharacterized protein n=1 Tax=Phascolomyces articulosus TaxID=60185 RepID=A0AAD5PJI4_9FUNG|nr:hypothetical protein BDA99DRAFT_531527 [Phascolomyces articulosus]
MLPLLMDNANEYVARINRPDLSIHYPTNVSGFYRNMKNILRAVYDIKIIVVYGLFPNPRLPHQVYLSPCENSNWKVALLQRTTRIADYLAEMRGLTYIKVSECKLKRRIYLEKTG